MEFLFPYLASIFLFIIIFAILALWREEKHSWAKERQILLDRIMTRSLEEFHTLNDTPVENKVEEPEDPNLVDMNDPQVRAQLEGSEED